MKKPKETPPELIKTKFQYYELAQLRFLLDLIDHFSPNFTVKDLRKMLE